MVICSQLGFFDGVALAAGNHGGGTGEVILNGVTCKGREETLQDCVWSGYKQASGLCDHSKDASVRCYTNCKLQCLDFTYSKHSFTKLGLTSYHMYTVKIIKFRTPENLL